jgi:hypothetical protein
MESTNMIKHIWSVLCKESKIDADSNLLTIVDVLEKLDIRANPPQGVLELPPNGINFPLRYEVTSMLFRDNNKSEESISLEIKILDPKGKETHKYNSPILFSAGIYRMRVRTQIEGLSIKDSGMHWFIVSLKDSTDNKYREVARLPLEIVVTIQWSSSHDDHPAK